MVVDQPTQFPENALPIKNWEAVWKQEAVSLDIIKSERETKFPLTIFCHYPKFTRSDGPFISQGDTIIISKFAPTSACYFVDQFEMKDDSYAYLRVIGVTEFGVALPHNHDFFPTSIIVVPTGNLIRQ
jgi:hypothetical protein